MKMKIGLVLLVLGLAQPALALQLSGDSRAGEGETVVRTGFNYLGSIISPPPTYTHVTGLNKAKLMEQYLSVTHGFGTILLEDLEVELRGTLFQNREELLNGTVVHPTDNGGFMSLRVAGNFIRTLRFSFGTWLQGDIPIGVNKEKFVKSNMNYVSLGLQAAYEVLDPLVLSQSVSLGSGLFSPNTKNPNLQSATLGAFNIGSLLFGHDFVLQTGVVVEADLTSRIDAAYAASALGNGEIKNLVLITPFLIKVPFAKRFGFSAGYAIKWVGKSVRGAKYYTAELSAKF